VAVSILVLLAGVTVLACAPPRQTADQAFRRALVSGGWAAALRAVAHDCGDARAPKELCPPADLAARAAMPVAREMAYARLLHEHPLRVEVGVATKQEMEELAGFSLPDDANDNTMVVVTRVRLPAMPADVTWSVSSPAAYLTRDLSEQVVYGDPSSGDVEGFVVALGGAARPSSLARWNRKELTSVAEYRTLRTTRPILDEDRYGVPYPTASATASSERASPPSLTELVVEAYESGLLSFAVAPVTLVLDALLLTRAPPPRSSPEYEAWAKQIRKRRHEENTAWVRDPRVGALVRLWRGTWDRRRDAGAEGEVVATSGFEVTRPRPGIDDLRPPVRPAPLRTDAVGELVLVLTPRVSGEDLPGIVLTVRVPRKGDLRADLEAFARTGAHPVVRNSLDAVASWVMGR